MLVMPQNNAEYIQLLNIACILMKMHFLHCFQNYRKLLFCFLGLDLQLSLVPK